MSQREWKIRLGGPGVINIHKFRDYTIAISSKYGSWGIQYNNYTNDISRKATDIAKQLMLNNINAIA